MDSKFRLNILDPIVAEEFGL